VRRSIAIIAGSAVAASSLALAVPAQAAETVPGGGASFPAVFMQQCAADFNGSQKDFTITYTSTGSGTGKGNFSKGTFVFGMTDSKYSSGEPSWDWEYVPLIGGSIALPINLKNATTGRTLGSSIQLKQTTAAKIFGGVITKWNHPEILKDNPRIAKSLPATNITISYRSDSSGTTNNFLQYMNAWAPTIFGKVQDDISQYRRCNRLR
jgi:phosphate transport system substrate-binding protein